MTAYGYIRLYFDFGDLSEMNRLSSVGWRVVSVQREIHGDADLKERPMVALMERPLA